MSKSVDYIIVGAGPAGSCAANILSKSGKKIIIVGKVLGGSYCSINSISSEVLVNFSKSYEKFRLVKNSYLSDEVENVSLDFKRIKKLVDTNVNKSKKAFLESMEENNVEFIEGSACFSGSNLIDITSTDGKTTTYKFKKCLIATGAMAPKTSIYNNKKSLDVAAFVNMEELPESVAIIGGGALGVEVASFFTRFGSKVTIVERNDRLLSMFDPYISKKYEDTLKKRGVNVITSHDINKIERVGQKYIALSEAGPIESEEVFLCIGRVAAVSDLMLEKAGINLDDNGHIVFGNNLQTDNQNIYVAGDVSHIMMNSSWAYYSATVAAKNMMGADISYMSEILPVYIDSDPEVAMVGLSEEQAKERGLDYGVVKYAFSDAYGFTNNSNSQTVIKTVYEKNSKTFLGIQAMGRGANNLIAIFAIIIKLKLNIEQIPDFVYIDPVFNDFFNDIAEKLL